VETYQRLQCVLPALACTWILGTVPINERSFDSPSRYTISRVGSEPSFDTHENLPSPGIYTPNNFQGTRVTPRRFLTMILPPTTIVTVSRLCGVERVERMLQCYVPPTHNDWRVYRRLRLCRLVDLIAVPHGSHVGNRAPPSIAECSRSFTGARQIMQGRLLLPGLYTRAGTLGTERWGHGDQLYRHAATEGRVYERMRWMDRSM
jgi:hypothetical protein